MLLNIQRVLYINLTRRPDRGAEVIRELQSLRIPEDNVIRIEAVDAEESREKAIVSCCRSHIAALECAMRNGWDEVLEDDFKLVHSAERTKARWAHFRDMVPTYQVAFASAQWVDHMTSRCWAVMMQESPECITFRQPLLTQCASRPWLS